MKRTESHVVVGAGIAGCLAAIMRRRAGYEVTLLERNGARCTGAYPVCTQTSNIVSENHSGAEYPFDPRSARDCLDGRIENERLFPLLIFGGKTYSRIIAAQSMMDDGHDIISQCRANMEVIRSHYARRCEQDPSNSVFGEPSSVCREISTVPGVEDAASTFLTPQRGINPVLVSTILDWELRALGVDFREDSEVTAVTRGEDGRYRVEYTTADGAVEEHVVADQISLCTATGAFGMAKRLNPAIVLPEVFMALRAILYVDLPDGTEKNFTCLKLEDSYGGMFSPLNDRCAMIYHPPAAHIMNVVMDPQMCNLPAKYAHYLRTGHPELEQRAEWTLERLREFYPELRRSRVLRAYLKVAVNTVPDSRVRRNIGVFRVLAGATMTVLSKWTMCAMNTRRELSLALEHSVSSGNVAAGEASDLLAQAMGAHWKLPPTWTSEPATLTAQARKHAVNMNVPEALAQQFQGHREALMAVQSCPAASYDALDRVSVHNHAAQ
jgi:glycine/D-amino acid oxidase-like deaminating enzyme